MKKKTELESEGMHLHPVQFTKLSELFNLLQISLLYKMQIVIHIYI